MRPAALVLILTLLGAGLLHVAAEVLDPPEVLLADLAAHEGARVVVAGEATRPRAFRGGAVFDLSDGAARVPVLTGGELPEEGAWLRVTGIVVRWGGTMALDADAWG